MLSLVAFKLKPIQVSKHNQNYKQIEIQIQIQVKVFRIQLTGSFMCKKGLNRNFQRHI